MTTTELCRRAEAEHHARAKLVALAHGLGYTSYESIRSWRFVGRIEPEGLDWFERRTQDGTTLELHIDDAGVCWEERRDSWRVLGPRAVKLTIFLGM